MSPWRQIVAVTGRNDRRGDSRLVYTLQPTGELSARVRDDRSDSRGDDRSLYTPYYRLNGAGLRAFTVGAVLPCLKCRMTEFYGRNRLKQFVLLHYLRSILQMNFKKLRS